MSQLLIIGYVWPEPNSSAAGKRMMQLINYFLSQGYSVTFATTAAKSQYMENIENLGVLTESIKLNSPCFDRFLINLRPDLVLFDRFMTEEQFGWRVSENCPEAIKILDTEDLHFLRRARQQAFRNKGSFDQIIGSSELAKREIASIFRCDLSLIISEIEMGILIKHFTVPEALILHLPFMIPALHQREISELPSFKDRLNFISIGNFRHEPNWDAVLHLKETIWPLIRKQLPEAQLQIFGAYPTQKASKLNEESLGFIVKGWAHDAFEVIRKSRVLLAPLRFGAGLKGKLLEAMQNGTPSVTTSIGSEGMHKGLPWNGRIENNPTEFAQAAVLLYKDETEWAAASSKGFEIIRNIYDEDHLQKKLSIRIVHLKNELREHRKANFIGSMLSHHALQSTKYLSKYIEMKNKLNDGLPGIK